MVLYHVSPCPTATAIVTSRDGRASDPETSFSPRCPDSKASEPDTPRICVAPKVWQCLVSALKAQEKLFVYRLRCMGAITATQQEHGVEDALVTEEHWITDEVIDTNGGEIALTCVGVIAEAGRTRLRLWNWMKRCRDNNTSSCCVDEMAQIWQLDGATSPPEWRLKLETPANSEEESQELLQLPPMWSKEFDDVE
jgi:hypothetical protein